MKQAEPGPIWLGDGVNIQLISPQSLKAYEKNPKKHPQSQIQQICKSILEWGFTQPILVDDDLMVLAGHGRLEAAIQLSLDSVPVVVAQGWTEAQKRAYVIADNKIAENGKWNAARLSAEVGSLLDEWGEPGIEGLLGFEESEIAALLCGEVALIDSDPEESRPSRKQTQCQSGDLKVACTAQEKELLESLAVEFESRHGLLAGFVGWLSQCGKRAIEAESRKEVCK